MGSFRSSRLGPLSRQGRRRSGSPSGGNATPTPCRSAVLGLGAEFAPARQPSRRLFDGTAPTRSSSSAPRCSPSSPRPGRSGSVPPRPRCRRRATGLVAGPGRTAADGPEPFRAVELRRRDPPGFLDLVTVGTATLLFEEAPVGEPSAFRLARCRRDDIDGDQNGQIRITVTSASEPDPRPRLRARFPRAELPSRLSSEWRAEPERRSRWSRRCCRAMAASPTSRARRRSVAADAVGDAGPKAVRAARRSSASAG